MATTRSEIADHAGEREPLLSDARAADAQLPGGDGSKGGISLEPIGMRVISVMTCFGSVGCYSASIGVCTVPTLLTVTAPSGAGN
jgi:hypothetical protein